MKSFKEYVDGDFLILLMMEEANKFHDLLKGSTILI
jgi:hypothetical protein